MIFSCELAWSRPTHKPLEPQIAKGTGSPRNKNLSQTIRLRLGKHSWASFHFLQALWMWCPFAMFNRVTFDTGTISFVLMPLLHDVRFRDTSNLESTYRKKEHEFEIWILNHFVSRYFTHLILCLLFILRADNVASWFMVEGNILGEMWLRKKNSCSL